jgi:hypothetical protein
MDTMNNFEKFGAAGRAKEHQTHDSSAALCSARSRF